MDSPNQKMDGTQTTEGLGLRGIVLATIKNRKKVKTDEASKKVLEWLGVVSQFLTVRTSISLDNGWVFLARVETGGEGWRRSVGPRCV
jgi:hypothetical protein